MEWTIPADVAMRSIELIRAHDLDPWLYTGCDWLVADAGAPHVEREQWTVGFAPTVVSEFAPSVNQVAKIVGVGDDFEKVRRCEAQAQKLFDGVATARRSQPYYLDITHRDANKGAVVDFLARRFGVPEEAIATIGDQQNDVLMFTRSGFSIAMGNASDEVKAQASAITDSCNDEGFAKAVERFILAEG
jgi:hydroxymethylpyrimidine pyrophosphatase-like HAD family hydrolase